MDKYKIHLYYYDRNNKRDSTARELLEMVFKVRAVDYFVADEHARKLLKQFQADDYSVKV